MRLRNLALCLALGPASCSHEEYQDLGSAAELPSAQPIDQALTPKMGDDSGEWKAGQDSNNSDSPEGVANSGGGNFGLDPSLAGELKPLDELEPTEEGVISFSALSLAGTDIEALLDHIFPLGDEAPPPYTYPEGVQALDGEDVKLVGYMIPLTWKEGDVTELMLVRDLASCCFGGIPRPDEWAFVSFPEGESTEYFPYVPVLVSGPLKLYPLDKKAPKTDPESAKDSDLAMDIEAVFSIQANKIRRY